MSDDPIAKSLKERMDAGGLTQVIAVKTAPGTRPATAS